MASPGGPSAIHSSNKCLRKGKSATIARSQGRNLLVPDFDSSYLPATWKLFYFYLVRIFTRD